MRNRNRLVLASAIAGITSAASAGTFTTITVDGDMSDWASVPILVTDASADGNPIDIGTVQMANDLDNLYIRLSYITPVNPNVGPSIFLALDTDSSVATGFNIYGLSTVGSEAGFQNDFPFDQRTGFNVGSLSAAATISPIDFGNPAATVSSQEYAIPRNIAYVNTPGPVFANPGFNLMFWTDSSLAADVTSAVPYLFASANSGWNINASGDWNTNANWTYPTAPNAVDALAELGAIITGPQTVFSNAPVTVGTLKFDNTNQYIVGGTGSLTMDVSTGNAAINVVQGSHKINLPLTLNDSTTADVASAATLTIGDPLALGNKTLNKVGAGTMEVISTVSSTAGGKIQVSAGTANLRTNIGTNTSLQSDGGATNLFATQRVASVVINAGSVKVDAAGAAKVIRTGTLTVAAGKLDLTDNGLIVTSGSLAAVRGSIVSAYVGGAWTGDGITTSLGDSAHGVGYAQASQIGAETFLGETVSPSAILARYTLLGDTNLDGTVGFGDLLALAQAFGLGGQNWVNGDTNYDAIVNFNDLLSFAQNYNASLLSSGQLAQLENIGGASLVSDWALAVSMVPEPASMISIACATSLVLRRRRA